MRCLLDRCVRSLAFERAAWDQGAGKAKFGCLLQPARQLAYAAQLAAQPDLADQRYIGGDWLVAKAAGDGDRQPSSN